MINQFRYSRFFISRNMFTGCLRFSVNFQFKETSVRLFKYLLVVQQIGEINGIKRMFTGYLP